MTSVAYLPIVGDRYGPLVRHVFLVGMDLTGVSMRAQVRLSGDTPGQPLVDLLTVTNGNAEGLRLVDVTADGAGVPTSHVEIVINESTMEGLPYAGEVGDAVQFAWDWQITISGRKRRLARGEFEITGDGVTGADAAPANRPQGYSRPRQPISSPWKAARLTFGEEQVTITIVDADLVAPLATAAKASAESAEADAARASIAAGVAQGAARYFTSRVAGEAASVPDQAFATDDGAGNVIYYRRTAGGSAEIGRAVTPASLAAPGTAAGIGMQLALPNAVARDLAERGADAINVMDFIPGKALRNAILKRTVNNNIEQGKALAAYVQNAIDESVAQRRRLHFPAGLYNVAPREPFQAEGGVCNRCFAIRSHMDLYGEAGATLRIVDGVSTDAAPVFMCMFGTNEQLRKVSWVGLTMDMNGGVYVNGSLILNNPISPGRASGIYSLINQAHIFVTGTPDGNAALIDDALVDWCQFLNTPGVSCIVGAQSNSYGVRLGRRWTISHSQFRNNGLDTIDHSSNYGWFTDANVFSNLFENDVQFMTTGGLVAYEVHGANTKFTNNTVRRYWQGMWIDNNQSERVQDVLVADNLFDQIKCFGVLFFGINLIVEQTRRTKFIRNTVVFDNLTHPGIDLKIGFGAVTTPRGQSEIEVSYNTVQSGGSAVATATVVFSAPTTAGELHDQVTIDDNTSYGTTFGEVLKTNPTCGLGTISIRRNKRFNLSPGGPFTLPIGLSVSFDGSPSQIDYLIIGSNQCIDGRAPTNLCAFGTRIEGQIGVLDYQPETFRGMTQANYVEVSPAVVTRSGTFERTFPYDPPSLADGASVTTTVAFSGARVGDIVRGSFNAPLAGLDLSVWVSADDTVSVKFANRTGAPVDIGAGSIRVRLERPL